MPLGEKLVADIGEKINSLQLGISEQPWQNATKVVFVNALDKSVSELRELRGLFSGALEEIGKDPKEGKPDLQPFLQEFDKLLSVLENNLRFERLRKGRAKTVNELEHEETPELYADLEQKILGTLLKARYATERMVIFLRKQGFTPLTEKSSAKQVMQILERKEDELQQLRGRYEDIRKKSYMGYLEEETIVDTEQELAELGRRMALSSNDLEKSISFHKSQIEYIENSYAELKQKLDSMEETFSNYREKSEDLLKKLKKERDYAKKVVLDVEHETLQLRNTYTRELLGLQESKLAAKAEAEARFSAELKKTHRQLEEQADLAKHFRKIAEEKLGKEHNLEEKAAHLTLLLKTKEKHERIRKEFREAVKRAKGKSAGA